LKVVGQALLLLSYANPFEKNSHALIITGYKYDDKIENTTKLEDIYDNIKFIVHDPSGGIYDHYYLSYLNDDTNGREHFLVIAAESKGTSTNLPLQTVHLPDYCEDSLLALKPGVYFSKKEIYDCYYLWAPEKAEGYRIVIPTKYMLGGGLGLGYVYENEVPDFDKIIFSNMQIADTNKTSDTYKMEIGINDTLMPIQIIKPNLITITNNVFTYFNLHELHNADTDDFYIDMNEFKSKIKLNDTIDYKISVKVMQPVDSSAVNGYVVKFKYRKLFIIPVGNSNILQPGKTIIFKSQVGNDYIENERIKWTVEPTAESSGEGVVADSNIKGSFNTSSTAKGKYIIHAAVDDDRIIHYGKEATYEITVGSSTGLLQINPSKFKIGIFEDTALEAKVDGVAVSAQWSILDASGGVVDDSVDKTSGTISAGSSGVSSPSKSNSPGITALRCIYKAPEGHGEYIIRAAYGGKTAAVKITVMPLTMVLTIPSYMDINAVQEFFVTIKGITEPKTISALPDGGKITDVKQEFKAGTIPEDNEMIFTKNFSLGANDSSDKYTITAKLLGIPIDKSIQRSINIVKSITATPKGASIASGGKLPLEASINGGGIVKAVWTLEGANSGSIIDNEDGTKVYVAPAVPGTYKITAQYLDYTDEMYVTVTNTPSSLAITFSPLDPVIYPDEVIKIKAIVNEPKLYNGFNITNAGGELAGPVSYGVTPDAKSYFFEYSFSVPAGDNKETISIVAMIMESGEVLAKSTNTIKVVRSINVTPKNSTIATGEQLTLSATIIGGEKVKAEWSIDTAEGGSIVNNEDGTAVYTAPSAYGTYKITARYLEYFAETYVTVYSSVPTIKIVCSYPSVGAGMSIYGIYADLGNRNDEIIWSCESGSVSSNGRFCEYLAPATPGRYKLTATVKGTEVKDEIEIEVTAVSFIISPSTSIVKYGEKVQLEGVVTGTEAGTFEMSWQLEEPSAGGAIEVIGGQYSPDNKSGAPARMIMYNRRCIYTAPPETGLGIRYVKATCTQPFGKTWTARAKIKVIGEENPAAQLAINNVVSGKAIVNIDDNIDLRPNIIGANAGQQVIMVDNKDLQMTQDDAGSGIISDTWSYIPPMTPLINGTGGIFEVFFEMFNPYRHVLVKIEVPDVKIKMTPETIKLGVGESYTFRSDVSGLTSKPALTWTSDGVLMNVDNNSRIYTAPNVTGSGNIKSEFTYTVRNLQITRNASAAITIDDIFLSSPIDGVTVENGSTTQFNVSVAGAYNKAIDSIAVEGQTDGAVIENAPAGSGFMYTFKAPTYTGQFTSDAELYIKAVSSANKSKFGLFKVKVKRPR